MLYMHKLNNFSLIMVLGGTDGELIVGSSLFFRLRVSLKVFFFFYHTFIPPSVSSSTIYIS